MGEGWGKGRFCRVRSCPLHPSPRRFAATLSREGRGYHPAACVELIEASCHADPIVWTRRFVTRLSSRASASRRQTARSRSRRFAGFASPSAPPRPARRPPRRWSPRCGRTVKGLRDRALLLLGFAAAFRRSELVALDVSAIDWTRARRQPERLANVLLRYKSTSLARTRNVGK